MIRNLVLLLLFPPFFLSSQSYVSFITGDSSDIVAAPSPGTCLMGGATESDSAMTWFLRRASGGDVVVLRVTGTDGYNNYMYSGLPVSVNSVETLVIPSAAAANDPYVEQQIMAAEALFIAGGDQYDYVSYWKNSAVESAINYLINFKNVPVGGTSAGMAIMGQAYFDAANGTVSSATALSDPLNSAVSIGFNDFISNPVLTNVITDTHYDNPDRRGRHVVFLARMISSLSSNPKGIAADEYTAVCIDSSGVARVFGDYPTYSDYAYFIQPGCSSPNTPETLISGSALSWNRNQEAVIACVVPGTPTGQYTFDLDTWGSTFGGSWEHWYVQNGAFNSVPASNPVCLTSTFEIERTPLEVYPNPADTYLTIDNNKVPVLIYDSRGTLMGEFSERQIDISTYPAGIYFIRSETGTGRFIKR